MGCTLRSAAQRLAGSWRLAGEHLGLDCKGYLAWGSWCGPIASTLQSQWREAQTIQSGAAAWSQE